MIKIDINNVLSFVKEEDIYSFDTEIKRHYSALFNKKGKGNDFLGWINLPKEMLESDIISDIQATAKKLQEKSEIFVVIGIGGSYLGARLFLSIKKTVLLKLFMLDKILAKTTYRSLWKCLIKKIIV